MLASASGTAAVAKMPVDRILPESDGPFGLIEERPAYPWDAWSIIPILAKLWNKHEQEVEGQLMANFKSLVIATQ
jgi:TatD DNase family protein